MFSRWEIRGMVLGTLGLVLGVWVLHMSVLFQPEAQGWAATGRPTQLMVEGELNPVGFHQYTNLSAAVDLSDGNTFTIPARAHIVMLQAEGQNIRWRDAPYANGNTTNPTATVGMQIFAGDTLLYNGNLKAIEIIEEAGGAKVNAVFYEL